MLFVYQATEDFSFYEMNLENVLSKDNFREILLEEKASEWCLEGLALLNHD